VVTLTLLDPRQKTPVHKWQFAANPVICIGRSPDNHIVLSDILVSRYHLELHRTADGNWRLRSRGSNGTFLDGKLSPQGTLANGSIIQLGPTGPILKFEVQTTGQKTAPVSAENCTHAGNFPGNLFCVHCRQPLNVQRTIRQYQVLRLLGHGGMGTTFLACVPSEQPGQMPQLRVLKEMNAAMENIPKAQELFEREARILQSLSHPGIPTFFDYFVENHKKYLVMQLIHGQDLDKWVQQKGPVQVERAIAWMLQTCDVLSYIHTQTPPVIHRDLKPSNLIVRSKDSQVAVIDFGAVKESGNSPGTRIAVEGYSSPEQTLGNPQIQSDLYAIGATLIFLLTGQSPIKVYRNRGHGYRLQIQEIAVIPDPLKRVIQTATEPRLGDRYQTANQLAEALKFCL
jgi:serine/threonine protein kinase, bacterial